MSLEDQVSDGHVVVVDRATLPEGGFVALHDQRLHQNETVASVVGASDLLTAGHHENITIHLDEPLTRDQTLVAMLHRDTDRDRTYDFVATGGEDDGPYRQNGSAVVDPAAVNASASIVLPDQPTDGRSVLVDRVALSQPGFVAIHDERFLDGDREGSLLGTSTPLPAGVHLDVRVPLQEALDGESRLVAVPLVNASATDGGEPGPFTAGGAPVFDEAVASPTTSGNVSFPDQRSGASRVVVETVFAPEGGFVAVHDRTLDEGMTLESLRGNSTCLAPGLHRDVRVPLDPALNASDNLTSVLHRDTDDDCTFDFVTSDSAGDGPYADRRGIVRDEAHVERSAVVDLLPQWSDGHTVVVLWADLSDGGFLVAHDPRFGTNGSVDSALGHSNYLGPGLHENVTIDLDEPLQSSQRLTVVAHRDTDRDRAFDLANGNGTTDAPYLDKNGSPVAGADRVQVVASLVFHTQATRETVTVDLVTLHDGGFVVLHDGPPTAPDSSVLGHSDRLAPGTHANVTLPLDPRPEGNATLVAAVHHDTNETGSFEFVTSNATHDRPYLAGGEAISRQAQVTFLAEQLSADTQNTPSEDDETDANRSTGQGGTEAATEGSQAPAAGVPMLLALMAALSWMWRRRP